MSALAQPISWRDKLGVLMHEFAHFEQRDCPLTHRFAPGVYLREILMPAHSLVIGKRHKTRHFNIIVKGACTLISEDGSKTYLKAPYTFVSEPGVQKVLAIHEDCIWQTIHVTENRDMESLEAELIEPDDYPALDRTAEREAIAKAAQPLLEIVR